VSASLKLLHSSNPLQISITGVPVVEASCHYRSLFNTSISGRRRRLSSNFSTAI